MGPAPGHRKDSRKEARRPAMGHASFVDQIES
jgi:hypothetical protein